MQFGISHFGQLLELWYLYLKKRFDDVYTKLSPVGKQNKTYDAKHRKDGPRPHVFACQPSSAVLSLMARKGRKYDSRDRHSSAKGAPPPASLELQFPVDEGKFDASNPLVLPAVQKKKKANTKSPVVRQKVLSKKQRKRLEQILRRKQKKEDRTTILNELSKHQISKSELDAIKSSSVIRKRNVSETEPGDEPQEKKKVKLPKPDSIVTDVHENDATIVKYNADSSSSDEYASEDTAEGQDPDFVTPIAPEPDAESRPEREAKVKLVITEDLEAGDVRDSATRDRAAAEQTVYIRVDRTAEVEEARQMLPILAEEQAIMEAIRYNNVVIVCGETGSGKTTQIPQFLFEAGYAVNKKIGVTEPRRVAATSMSRRVAQEMSLSSDVVSYHIRYDRNVSEHTKIKFMTDGILLKEIQDDFLLTAYSAVIVDEAHERSVFSDILIGLLSRIVRMRDKKGDPLRLIIMSATLRVDSFADNARLFPQRPPILRIGSRQYPVTIHFSKETPENYIQAAFSRVCRIHRTKPAGGILVFVTGRNDVVTLCRKLKRTFSGKTSSNSFSLTRRSNLKKIKKGRQTKVIGDLLPKVNLDDFSKPEALFVDEHESDSDGQDEDDDETDDEGEFSSESAEPLHCLPLYSMLPKERQEDVFKPPPPGHRLCVIATNVAETSLTIPDVKYVVDSGKVKTKLYDKTTGVSAFLVEWCSKASADQRAGRAGRTSAGHCFRLYSSAIFANQFKSFSEPEIKLKPVDDLVLQMKSLGIGNIHNFPFPSPPADDALLAAERRLLQMGALHEVRTSVSVQGRKATSLTKLGQAMSNFPVSPRYARMFAFAYNEILPYITALVAGLTVQEVFVFAGNKKPDGEADANDAQRRSKWLALRKRWSGAGEEHLLGDLMVMLKAIGASEFSAGSASFSLSHGISHKAMCEVHRLRRQLTTEVNRLFALKSAGAVSPTLSPPNQTSAMHLRQIALVGFYDQVARSVMSTASLVLTFYRCAGGWTTLRVK